MKRILFLCMGNICRSPAAHCLFQYKVNKANLSNTFFIDSAGTTDYHKGSPPDSRMQKALQKKNIPIIGKSRPIIIKDLEQFDLILAMDKENLKAAKSLDKSGKWEYKIKLFANYLSNSKVDEVPDPYYGYKDGFELVLDMIEEGCDNLLNDLSKEL